jgi:hypothetical protein
MSAARMTSALARLERRRRIRCWSEATGGRPRELVQGCAESAESAESLWPEHLSALSALSAQAETWEPPTSDAITVLRPSEERSDQ